MLTASGWARVKDVAGALFFMLLGALTLRQMRLEELPPQASWYPALLIHIIFALCLVLLAKAAVGGKKSAPASSFTPEEIAADASMDAVAAVAAATEEKQEKIGVPTLFVIVLSFLYVLLMPHIGFILASALMMIAFLLVMGVRSLPVLVLVPTAEIAFLWYVFEKLLTVFLPDAQPLRALLGIG
jgi:cell division protein FtsW (lipid II flippase)